MRAFWAHLGVSKKLYVVMGVMAFLIASELLTLRFAMNTLSAVRGFVNGEGIWSKAQKDAVISLQKYARTRDPKYYTEFNDYLKVPMGDRIARREMEKTHPDVELTAQGFIQGGIHPEDVPGLIRLVLKFNQVSYLSRALAIWGEGDEMVTQLVLLGEDLHQNISANEGNESVLQTLGRIESLNEKFTVLENNFSRTLGEGSRWLENLVLMALFFAVLMIESTGLILTVSFSQTLTRALFELNSAAQKVGQGDFKVRVPVRSRDELGQLASSLNKMTEDLEHSRGDRLQAEKASELKSLFLANMSHEIRTPLGAILGFADLLLDPEISLQDREKYVKVIRRTGENLTKLINDILDLSKVEAGHLETQKSVFCLPQLIAEIDLMLKAKWAGKSVQVIFQTLGPLPEWIETDQLRLRQILMNIIGNAVKFTDQGRVVVTGRVQQNDLIFTIQDSGTGISPEKRKLLFQTFSQVDNSLSRKYEGTGLGLVLSRRLARLLGGDVSLLENENETGSTFKVRINFTAKTKMDLDIEKSRSPEPVNPVDLKNKRVLVVDDVEDNRDLLRLLLEKRGLKVSEAINGAEGVRQALTSEFDVILMDIQMPVMDGYTATRELRSWGYDRPILALTAHAMKEDHERCLAAGCNDYLTKPIQIDKLIMTISKYLAVPDDFQNLTL